MVMTVMMMMMMMDWLIVTHVMFTHSNGEEVQCVSLLVAVIAEAV